MSTENRFGGIDADVDGLLASCFRNHPAYVEAQAHRRFLIVGRKGSGKTAIYRKLITDSSYDRLAFGHSFDDYPWQHHDLQAEVGVPVERRYLHSWNYLIEMSLARVLLNRDQSQPWSEDSVDDISDLERFVVDSYGTRDPDLRQLFSPSRSLRLKGKLKVPFAELDGEGMPLSHLPVHIQEVNTNIARAVVNAMNPGIHYYVCFDQLDLGFEPNNPQYHDRLIGLILAARHMNALAAASKKNLTVAVFLRDDIYEILKFEDKNKTTEAHLVSVHWSDKEVQGSLTLRQLMERRFGEVIDGSESLAWSEVFDELKQMPGRQDKYQHICDRTFLRPRDMIKFCNEIALAHEQRGGETGKFENIDISDARERYSRYLLRELEDEIHKHVPLYKEYLDVIRAIGSLQFKRDRFVDEFEKHEKLTGSGTTAIQALRDLVEFSVIGVLKSGGAVGGSRILWRYRESESPFKAEVETFRVHAGFKEALELIQGER